MEVVAYRLAGWDTPLWASPNRRAGRFHAEGDPPTQYWSLHPMTPWAELLRYDDRRTPEEADDVRARLWVGRLELDGVRRIGFADASRVQLVDADLVDDDWSACQALARRLRSRRRGPVGLRVPSAALPGTENVVLFGERVAAPYQVDPVDRRLDVPVAHAAESARPLAELLPFVRWRGEPHPGDVTFAQPSPR
jgi:RES domain-containing protein